jgi:catechol 2,3-dioxygenase-like lactoylglutathione lyase family enzyme
MKAFYIGLLGLQELGHFTGHDGYDGVFLGLPGADWHLEFTVSETKPEHQPDADDLLVFYLPDEAALKVYQGRMSEAGVLPVTPVNPYWVQHGVSYTDPDGFGIMLALKS